VIAKFAELTSHTLGPFLFLWYFLFLCILRGISDTPPVFFGVFLVPLPPCIIWLLGGISRTPPGSFSGSSVKAKFGKYGFAPVRGRTQEGLQCNLQVLPVSYVRSSPTSPVRT
jgi:hypothetical protein